MTLWLKWDSTSTVKIKIGDYVLIEYSKRRGTVIDDRGGRVGRWKIEADDGSTWHASSRDLTVIGEEQEIEDAYEVLANPEPIKPIDWEKRSKESLQNILKKYS